MKREDTQIHIKHATLMPEEKAILRLRLFEYIQSSHQEHPLFRYGRFWLFLRVATSGVVGIVLMGAGMSYAAENALPGDMLYAVKVEVNERLRTWAAVSGEAQAEWSVVRTTRRLEELERLATTGSLNDTLREEIASRFDQNTEAASKAIVSLKKDRITAAADTSSRLESSLRVHERMLVQVAEERADISSQIHVILDTVRKKAESVSEIRQEIEKEIADADDGVVPIEDTATSSAELLPGQEVEIEVLDKTDER
ncbi:MAG: hypothetical protein G01um101470_1012 [Parcubacteria group bacterium Gr01-1014_70]|nr:MAG: hypothetical protein G01um101470_1012 [Parcubacteria group bacterium Gr01-1014_70]